MAILVNQVNLTLCEDMEKNYFTAKEVAIYLGLSEHTIRAWVKFGRIPFYKFGRAVRFDLRKLEPWIRKKKYDFSDEDCYGQCEKIVL